MSDLVNKLPDPKKFGSKGNVTYLNCEIDNQNNIVRITFDAMTFDNFVTSMWSLTDDYALDHIMSGFPEEMEHGKRRKYLIEELTKGNDLKAFAELFWAWEKMSQQVG